MGGKEKLFLSHQKKVDTIVVVEDMISAMRVGEVMPAAALRGTHANSSKLAQLCATANDFVLWLDGDTPGRKAAKALEIKLQWLGDVKVIHTEKDPKCYSNEEIERYVYKQ